MTDLDELIRQAATHVMTPQEVAAQRESWVVGEMMLQDERLTREEAVARYRQVAKAQGYLVSDDND